MLRIQQRLRAAVACFDETSTSYAASAHRMLRIQQRLRAAVACFDGTSYAASAHRMLRIAALARCSCLASMKQACSYAAPAHERLVFIVHPQHDRQGHQVHEHGRSRHSSADGRVKPLVGKAPRFTPMLIKAWKPIQMATPWATRPAEDTVQRDGLAADVHECGGSSRGTG
jgi:hypothetical protein